MQQHQPQASRAYSEDFYAWTQHQAKLIRALNSLSPDVPAGLDLDQVAEEIEGLGSADLNAVRSFIRQILIHLIKAASAPDSQAVAHWRMEAATFHAEMEDRFTSSMRQLIDMQALWHRARSLAELSLQEYGGSAAHIAVKCPYSLNDITTADFNFDEALKKLTDATNQV